MKKLAFSFFLIALFSCKKENNEQVKITYQVDIYGRASIWYYSDFYNDTGNLKEIKADTTNPSINAFALYKSPQKWTGIHLGNIKEKYYIKVKYIDLDSLKPNFHLFVSVYKNDDILIAKDSVISSQAELSGYVK